MTKRPAFLMMNLMDRDATRQQWHDRFQNRSVKTKSAESKLNIRAAGAGMTEILLYDEIGYWGVTAKEFATALAGIATPAITVRINSPGGDVFDGLAIFNSLKAHAATVTCVVDGIAASAASFIALAGASVTMAENSFMMIHNAWGLGIGNAADMRALADTLDKIDGQIADIYAKKTGKTKDEMLAAMAEESWYTAAEAKVFGLCDNTTGEPESGAEPGASASANNSAESRVNNMRRRLTLASHND